MVMTVLGVLEAQVSVELVAEAALLVVMVVVVMVGPSVKTWLRVEGGGGNH